ncbi:hypothetical protein [Flammeovirga pacifica]|nr:hypothetical protein [Flammeovirga pacifica]
MLSLLAFLSIGLQTNKDSKKEFRVQSAAPTIPMMFYKQTGITPYKNMNPYLTYISQ